MAVSGPRVTPGPPGRSGSSPTPAGRSATGSAAASSSRSAGLWFRPQVTGRAQRARPRGRSSWPRCTGPSPTSASPPSSPTASSSSWPRTSCGSTACWAGCSSTLGAFPVHRESADREALHHAEEVLRRGQVLVLFPEGTRQEGADGGRAARGGGLPGRPDRSGHRAHRHRQLRPGHAQGPEDPQAAAHPAGGRRTPGCRRPAARAAGCRGARSTPPPTSSDSGSRQVYDQARR